MVVTDADSGKQVGRVEIGAHPDAAAYDPKRGLIYSSNFDGTLTVVHEDTPDHYRVVQNVTTKRGARTMALDPLHDRAYLVTSEFGPSAAADGRSARATPASNRRYVGSTGCRRPLRWVRALSMESPIVIRRCR